MQEPDSQDIYAAPSSSLKEAVASDRCFYSVAPRKMLILYIGTFGMYQIYWFYKHWSEWRAARNEPVLPLMRAVFAVFFTFSLARKIDQTLGSRSADHPHNAITAPLVLVVTQVVNAVLGNPALDAKSVEQMVLLPIVALGISAWATLTMQRAANDANGDPSGADNASLTGANWFWLLIGAVFWLASLVSLFAPGEAI